MENTFTGPLPIEVLIHQAQKRPNQSFLIQNTSTGQKIWTYKEVLDEVYRLASFLQKQGLKPDDHVALYSKNCAEWIIADLAIWAAGCVSVPIYPNLTPQAAFEIIGHSDARFILLGKLDRPSEPREENLKNAPPSLRIFESKVKFDFVPDWKDIRIQFDAATEKFIPVKRKISDLSTIVYTSGTTGQPKGAMHSFRSFVYPGRMIPDFLKFNSNDRFFSFLPLAHVAERFIVETLALYSGATITFAESLETFAKNLRDCRPTVFMAVPRIWAKLHDGLAKKIGEEKLEKILSIPVLRVFARKFFLRALGLDATRVPISGASPIDPKLLQKIKNLGIPIMEGYGLTENLAYSHFNPLKKSKAGTVGTPLPGVSCALSASSEVLIKSPTNMLGFYKNSEETQKSFEGEYLKTGDTGEIDSEGYLKIVGRLKDLFKTSKGKYVAPGPIELKLFAMQFFDQVCVMGSGLAQPLAVCVLNPTLLKSLNSPALKAELTTQFRSLNRGLEAHEKISKIVVLSQESWSVENGLLTPTMKVKRSVVERHYSSRIESWVSESEIILTI